MGYGGILNREGVEKGAVVANYPVAEGYNISKGDVVDVVNGEVVIKNKYTYGTLSQMSDIDSFKKNIGNTDLGFGFSGNYNEYVNYSVDLKSNSAGKRASIGTTGEKSYVSNIAQTGSHMYFLSSNTKDLNVIFYEWVYGATSYSTALRIEGYDTFDFDGAKVVDDNSGAWAMYISNNPNISSKPLCIYRIYNNYSSFKKIKLQNVEWYAAWGHKGELYCISSTSATTFSFNIFKFEGDVITKEEVVIPDSIGIARYSRIKFLSPIETNNYFYFPVRIRDKTITFLKINKTSHVIERYDLKNNNFVDSDDFILSENKAYNKYYVLHLRPRGSNHKFYSIEANDDNLKIIDFFTQESNSFLVNYITIDNGNKLYITESSGWYYKGDIQPDGFLYTTRTNLSTQAIALNSGTAGQNIDIVYSGPVEYEAPIGTKIESNGVKGYVPVENVLDVIPWYATGGGQ